jgi:hypothetical protein
MTIFKDIIRVRGPENQIRNYAPKVGIESVVKPYQIENGIFDVMFRTSDMNPCLSERLLMEDINREVERLQFLFETDSDRKRDSQFKKDLKDDKTSIRFRTFEDNKELESLDKFKSKSECIYGNENQVSPDPSLRAINEQYIKEKKKYLSLIDIG